MIAIDSDVLAVHHLFVNDARFSENQRFMEKSARVERGVTIYNLSHRNLEQAAFRGQDQSTGVHTVGVVEDRLKRRGSKLVTMRVFSDAALISGGS